MLFPLPIGHRPVAFPVGHVLRMGCPAQISPMVVRSAAIPVRDLVTFARRCTKKRQRNEAMHEDVVAVSISEQRYCPIPKAVQLLSQYHPHVILAKRHRTAHVPALRNLVGGESWCETPLNGHLRLLMRVRALEWDQMVGGPHLDVWADSGREWE